MKKIVLAVDLSQYTLTAIKRAADLAHRLNAELNVLHVIDDRYHHGLLKTIGSMAESQLKGFMQEALTKEQISHSKIHIISGEPYMEIVQFANNSEAVCTILGMHRKQSLELFVGTTADRVSRYNSGLTLLAKNNVVAPYENVLIATDFSAASQKALKAIKVLAPSAAITVVHFPDFANGPFLSPAEAKSYQQVTTIELKDKLEQEVRQVLGETELDGVQLIVMNEKPLQGILNIVAEKSIDLVALGKHERTAIGTFLSGSLSRTLLSKPPCDVLVARV